MTLDIIVVYVSACHSPAASPLPIAVAHCPKLRSLPKAGTPWRSQRQPHVVCRCVMYDSMKCDIFMLNYFCKSEKCPSRSDTKRNATQRSATQSKRELRWQREQESESGRRAAGRGEKFELKVDCLKRKCCSAASGAPMWQWLLLLQLSEQLKVLNIVTAFLQLIAQRRAKPQNSRRACCTQLPASFITCHMPPTLPYPTLSNHCLHLTASPAQSLSRHPSPCPLHVGGQQNKVWL